MSEFNWRSAESYAELEDAGTDDFAWEYLRRNSEYQEDYRTLQRARSRLSGVDQKFRLRWGLSFRR
jgi:Family of unknown function (DUF6499)